MSPPLTKNLDIETTLQEVGWEDTLQQCVFVCVWEGGGRVHPLNVPFHLSKQPLSQREPSGSNGVPNRKKHESSPTPALLDGVSLILAALDASSELSLWGGRGIGSILENGALKTGR